MTCFRKNHKKAFFSIFDLKMWWIRYFCWKFFEIPRDPEFNKKDREESPNHKKDVPYLKLLYHPHNFNFCNKYTSFQNLNP